MDTRNRTEPVVSDPNPEPKFTKYLLGRKFIYLKDPDPNGSYPNSIRISEVPGLVLHNKPANPLNLECLAKQINKLNLSIHSASRKTATTQAQYKVQKRDHMLYKSIQMMT